MKRIVVLSVIILAIAGCSKDKVETKPHLKFKSFNGDKLPLGSDALITLEFTDQEGDLDSIFVIRQRVNRRSITGSQIIDLGIPKFGGQNSGELQVRLDYGTQLTFNLPALRIPGSNPAQFEPDTLNLRFYAIDKAGNASDTIGPERLILMRQ